MSRTTRIRDEYSKPDSNPNGASRDKANLDYWADRAASNSQLAPRASNGPMTLHNAAEPQPGGSPGKPFSGDARAAGKQLDHEPGATKYMPKARRTA
jgi:hypothetical protein